MYKVLCLFEEHFTFQVFSFIQKKADKQVLKVYGYNVSSVLTK